MRNLLGQVDEIYMKEPLAKLRREIGRIYADPLTGRRRELGSPSEDERIVMCRHCGASIKLIGTPPKMEPEEPSVALYYPIQFCPLCGHDVGRALGAELLLMPIMGAAVWHDIQCSRCGSTLRWKSQALPPQYISALKCPVCGNDLGVEGLAIEVVSAKPWPPVAEELEEIPWKPIIIVSGAFAMLFTAIGIGYFIKSKKK